MAEFWTVCLLSIAMFIGCAVAGWIPLACTLSQRKIQLFTIFGAGLLVGTALAVIIPEGVQTMYSTPPVEVVSSNLDHAHVGEKSESEDETGVLFKSAHIEEVEDVKKHEHHHTGGPHHVIGVSLLLGFVFMLLVDQLGGAGHSHPTEIRLEASDIDNSEISAISDELNQSKVGTARSQQPDQRSKGHTATIGLVVHAAADGVAMGAAASTDRSDLQFIVFLAIMLHKAPAAFGLVSFLVHEGLELRKVKRHLFAFSLAAPLLAVLTFLLLNQKDKQLLEDFNATGIAMLFSAGTFLYVATVHVLPEVSHSNSGKGKLGFCDVFILVIGCLFPLILNLSHSHHH
ncbi:zinc transporter ZIP9 isoform X1 [Ciona intestinalis]